MNIKAFFLYVLLFALAPYCVFSQELTQNIKGTIIDEVTQTPLPFATVVLVGTDPVIGTTSDIDGQFLFEDIPVKRYDIQASYVGYEPVIIPEVLVTRAKEVVLTFKLREMAASLDEVVIKPRIQKEKALNAMATVSARMLSVEDANKYAGGFDDPARLASAFAGVASSVSSNAIVIRGNAPKFLQWKIEGIEIPNPNHFADLNSFGGGGLSALSSNLLANSDFFTGAFPAEYNNALSGVFDIRMRSGNSGKHEHSVQLGLIGIDVASEGPLSKNSKASYLFNYRYSTLSLISPILPEGTEGINYQDLAFKFKFPTKKAGTFSLWGIGLIDKSGNEIEEVVADRQYYDDIENEDARQYMGAAGINHKIMLSDKSFLNSTLAITNNGLDIETDRLNNAQHLVPQSTIDNRYYNIVFKSFIKTKFSKKHANKTGVTATRMTYDLSLKDAQNTGDPLNTIVSENGSSNLLAFFSNSKFSAQNFTLNLGINAQYFTLNDNYTIEPRVGLAYQLHKNHELSIGYGLHSRLEPINFYFIKPQTANAAVTNKELDFTKAHHFILGYDWNINEHLHLKIEPYYQLLYDIPSIENSSYSLLNLQNDWFITDTFTNSGEGKNYGVDVTLERYLDNGLYYMFTGSIFESKYKTDLNEWYNTRFNKGYLVNALIGKEFPMGKTKQNILGVNLRVGLQGGERHSLVDEEASLNAEKVIYDETTPFTEQVDPSLVSHITVNYTWNKKKSSQQLSLKIINANKSEEFFGHRYNFKHQTVDEQNETIMIPNISYKLSF
ncbi:carboxypeptidase-like regulatory domain-containing protein [Aquimarina hainanensis]|uniref:Carboxypeptidase-like regulatory domain-containing protein n=1 Tax=Aquimarina hainanensis TaxID=1578017 RepID=A0ABW5NCK4_9FLAO